MSFVEEILLEHFLFSYGWECVVIVLKRKKAKSKHKCPLCASMKHSRLLLDIIDYDLKIAQLDYLAYLWLL